jgi:hypothetical protein
LDPALVSRLLSFAGMSKKISKLTLTKQTLRALADGDLDAARGASIFNFCGIGPSAKPGPLCDFRTQSCLHC